MPDKKTETLAHFLFKENVEALTLGKFFPIRRDYAVDSIQIFDSTIAFKFWFKAGAQPIAIVIMADNEYDEKPYVAKINYPRDDASNAINAPAVGLSLFIASPIIKSAKVVKISLVFSSKEVLVVSAGSHHIKFNQLLDGINFDLQRSKLNFEPYSYTPQGDGLVKFISGCWQLFLSTETEKHTLLNYSKNKVGTSIVTVFYKNTSLASMYPLLTRVLDLGDKFEIVLCFQEASIFKRQIEWIRFLAESLNLNIKIIMFEDNVGFSAANNLGVEYSSGEVVILLNPDIICNDKNIYQKISAAAMKTNALLGATLLSASGDVMHNGIDFEHELNFDSKKPIEISRTYHIGRHLDAKSIKSNTLQPAVATTGALIAIRKKLWDELGGLSEKYVYAHFEDVDFCYRAKQHGIDCLIYQNTSLIHVESYSSGEGGMSHSIKLINSNLYNSTVKVTS